MVAELAVELDRHSSSAPMYAQIRRVIAVMIADNRYQPGDLLPSVPSLSEQLGVSRATIIKAFDGLEEENLIERIQGKGTFVADRPRPNSIVELHGFSAVTKSSGSLPGQSLVAFTMLFADDADRTGPAANFPSGQDLVSIERIRFIDGRAVGHQLAVIPAVIADRAGIDRPTSAAPGFSLYEALAAVGHDPVIADETLRAVACPVRIASHLDVAAGSAMMRIRRQSHDRDGHLVEAVEAHYIGSLYEYRSTPTAQPNDRPHERFTQ